MRVSIEPDKPLPTPVVFIMPRSVPGNYGIVKYDRFVRQLEAHGADGVSVPMIKSSYGAPRWKCSDSNFRVRSISYIIDLKKMDDELHAASDKSILRSGFAGILNYSVLGWIENHDREPVTCTITSFISWPIFSTLAPSATPVGGSLQLQAADYYALADAQTFLGPRFRVKAYSAPVPLFVVDYSEGATGQMDDYAWEET
jgi:predicted metalloprotease with PDZ domain